MTSDLSVTRELGLFEFHQHPPVDLQGAKRWLTRAQNFFVEWAEASQHGASVDFESEHEAMVLVFGQAAEISAGVFGAQAPPRSVSILPPGRSSVRMAAGGACAVLSSQRGDLRGRRALNEKHFLEHDPRIVPAVPGYRRADELEAIRVIPIDSFDAPSSNPRLKMLQSATLSINWVEYSGLRDRRALSPHSHVDLEQATLGVQGDFVHHLREPWGRNADLWREDRHPRLSSPSLMVVPVNLIHTSEGVSEGHHLLIDIFSPPRRDFIVKGWVHNAGDYRT